ncbi:efflux RND transporter periplasmic adaptor subunit [Rhodomicrobium vannielii ATCC 17100]|uniref:efflux RND transporter periplasmic adaptor subunit n=1 Tax=Rhodomicrobium vannielii TaxID=1069 RepID=UPI00191B5745|nr:efflux RND transporter periplasmic adaptor subunit [Rhodomicrobium vannielii]MBJ7532775.1 efflux RND transporter periplasmic adaptor subunit [Rhodomicrobium vannielii ATCC 17100]
MADPQSRSFFAKSVSVHILALAILTTVFSGVYAWRSMRLQSSGPQALPPIEVEAMTVEPKAVPQELDAIGSLSSVNEVTITPEVAGRVISIDFEAGAEVAAGAELLRLYDAPERADLETAKAKLEFARLQFDRAQELAPKGAESRQMLQQRAAELAQGEAAVRLAEARLTQRTIRAPFAGRLGVRRVNLGQYVNAGEPLVTLTALDRLYVNFTLPQQELSKLANGGKVSVRTDAWPERDFEARINAIEPVVAAETRNISVQATLANADGALRPGLYVTAKVILPPRARAILVPVTAVVTGPSGDTAYVVRGGNVEIVPVETGRRFGPHVVVERGLKGGDVVITTGQLRLQPGAAITLATTMAKK